ncbi:hypothetical protein THAOC_31233 [Thalassiosira oceanica]|uniref:Plastid lipid-associated protein/fibrillin conserved domain-containing protein n=1 Tax=Thalassiosira oceanica TaxID=159749 RepID=K0R9P9_THAOC|nr:hypothetical protein THAOC_31233 [Thalassiosira oceanica]|eukprot:EJK49850.1 hypothetical protein THAOC_31233 [Thalassiosira oceanica]
MKRMHPLLVLALGIAIGLAHAFSSSRSATSWNCARSNRMSELAATVFTNSSEITRGTDVVFDWEDASRQMQALALLGPSAAESPAPDDLESFPSETTVPPTSDRRELLKKELATLSIKSFADVSDTNDELIGPARTAEDVMRDLEHERLPIMRPATHHSLNAHWSFVFTGVPTIGMRLITLLSRISTLFPFEILDFRDVALSVSDGQSKAKAVVEVKVCGSLDLLLEVVTSLRRPDQSDLDGDYCEFGDEDGRLLLEHFEGIWLNGNRLPTPQEWHTTRTLEITYMDGDIMVARTSGGAPHLLLRNTPLCYSGEDAETYSEDDALVVEDAIEECSIDGQRWTEFFR